MGEMQTGYEQIYLSRLQKKPQKHGTEGVREMADREKAIAVLEQHFSHERVFTPAYREALRMAIQALKKEAEMEKEVGNED